MIFFFHAPFSEVRFGASPTDVYGKHLVLFVRSSPYAPQQPAVCTATSGGKRCGSLCCSEELRLGLRSQVQACVTLDRVSRWSPHNVKRLYLRSNKIVFFLASFCGNVKPPLFVFFLGFFWWPCGTGGTLWDAEGLKRGSGIYQFGQLGAWGLATCSVVWMACPEAIKVGSVLVQRHGNQS